ncbi:MAG: methyltransferase domain-containing protein [Deltaproteobacteria bacterium]|nr:methyltransferase domain-containing protein [Deltaproteobacteria bacterium]
MKEHILSLLVCPPCKANLTLQSFTQEHKEVKDGFLLCSCGQWFPIIHFVPRLLLREYRGDYRDFIKAYGLNHLEAKDFISPHFVSREKQVQKSFGSKWMSQPTWGINGETKSFMRDWILDKYGWRNREGFKKAMESKRNILDAGTGGGRVVADFCEVNKDGEVFGVDISEAVEAAYQNTKRYPNAHIIQADLMELPFRKPMFDFILSEGVLHHTPDTRKAFETLQSFLISGGEIAVYIYKKKGPIREFCDDHLRQFTTQFSEQECWEFSKRMSAFGKTLSDLHIEFEVAEDIPPLSIKAGKYNLQRFFYYHIFKCFWNDRFTFDENNLINFDWYHPAHAWRHTPEELRTWCTQNDLDILWWLEEESGMTFRCRRKSNRA